MLGEIIEREAPVVSPFLVGGYQVYASPEARPRQTLVTEVRPPNGCFDVQVDLAPQVIGRVLRGDETFTAADFRDPLHMNRLGHLHLSRSVARAVRAGLE